jgi:solute carrier family 24 (sodium/potassium/calcium exchanger), member 6
LSPALTSIANFFKCSETLAGVTLVALGNGAPDVLVAIAGGSDGDFSFSIGSIFGAGLFVTSITLA